MFLSSYKKGHYSSISVQNLKSDRKDVYRTDGKPRFAMAATTALYYGTVTIAQKLKYYAYVVVIY